MAISRGQKIAGVIAVAILAVVAVKTKDDPMPVNQYATAPAASGCDPTKFEIVSKSARIESGYLIITALVRNNNATACGVRISTDLTDAKGAIVATDKGWPASVNNISAGQSYSFDVMFREGATTQAEGGGYRLDPIEARAW